MKQRYSAVVATLTPFSFLGESLAFSEKDLGRMAQDAAGCPVTDNFDPTKIVGRIVSGLVKDKQLICEIDLVNQDIDPDRFCVPSVIMNNKEGVTRMDMTGLTMKPSQPDLKQLAACDA
jgi:hypothetical protein